MSDILYVYGTLRPGKSKTVTIPGQMFDLGRFPGAKLNGVGEIICEPVEVNDWGPLDRYEGYYAEDPQGSLYIRRPLLVPYGINGFIYEFNREVNPLSLVESGDWLSYKEQNRGTHAQAF